MLLVSLVLLILLVYCVYWFIGYIVVYCGYLGYGGIGDVFPMVAVRFYGNLDDRSKDRTKFGGPYLGLYKGLSEDCRE